MIARHMQAIGKNLSTREIFDMAACRPDHLYRIEAAEINAWTFHSPATDGGRVGRRLPAVLPGEERLPALQDADRGRIEQACRIKKRDRNAISQIDPKLRFLLSSPSLFQLGFALLLG